MPRCLAHDPVQIERIERLVGGNHERNFSGESGARFGVVNVQTDPGGDILYHGSTVWWLGRARAASSGITTENGQWITPAPLANHYGRFDPRATQTRYFQELRRGSLFAVS